MTKIQVESEIPKASWDLYEMIQAFLQAPSYHLVFEAILILWIVWLILRKSYKPQRTVLTEQEKEELIAEWQPEPLVPDVDENHPILLNMKNRLVDSKLGKRCTINGKDCLNVATFNFLGMVGRSEIEEVAVKALRKYGVGSCGPRGFYGTVDVHLELEEKLAKFMGSEEVIVYSYGFSTIASAIPAYSKRGDVIFCDEGVHFAIQKGLEASRSRIKFFKHNDLTDLERLLIEQAQDDIKNPKKAKATRRFMVVEGLYVNYGDLCPLPKLVELKWKYKVRIFLDETASFGTMGATGRGITEHYGIDRDEIDLIAGSLETSLGSIGGFCAGKAYVVDHQRLSGLGYCFSASAPPMLTQAAITALEILDQTPDLLIRLRENSENLHKKLSGLSNLQVSGVALSPIKYLQLVESKGSRDRDQVFLRLFVAEAESCGIALTVANYLEKDEHLLPPPSIRLCVSCELDNSEIDNIVQVLSDSYAPACVNFDNR